MTDKIEDTTPAAPETPAEQAERVAKVGVKDHGFTVTGFGGEKMSGILADIADGDS